MTQPILNEEPLDHKSFEGSALDTQYLEQVDPYPTPSQYQLEFRVLFEYSGSFFVQLAYQDEVDPEVERYTEAQYINVEPVMSAGGRGIRGKELSLMTVMSRCLGKMSRWPQVLNNIQELGYNAVHFTPIQQYGESFSHYSLAG